MPNNYRVTYAANIREAVTIVEAMVGQGATEIHTVYAPESGNYSVTYTIPEAAPDGLIDELESLRNRVHNLNLYLGLVLQFLSKEDLEYVEDYFSGMPGYSSVEADEAHGPD